MVHNPCAVKIEDGQITHKHSLGCAYVYESTNNFTDGYGDRLVAKYMGRPGDLDVFNENLFKLCEFYGAVNEQLYFESNRGEVVAYAKKHGYLKYLCYETEIDNIKEQGDTSKNRKYGIYMNDTRKYTAIKYLRSWLYQVRAISDNGNKIYNLNTLLDIRLLKELQRWYLKGNFDAVSTMFILMFLIKTIEQEGKFAEKEKDNSTEYKNTIFNPDYLTKQFKR